VTEAIARLAADGPTEAELERALAQAEANFVYRLQTVGGFSGKSDQLNAYNVYRGDPGSFDADLARYLRLTAADVRDAARRLASEPRVALSVVPAGAADQALAGSVTAVAS
jgi:zinc protease